MALTPNDIKVLKLFVRDVIKKIHVGRIQPSFLVQFILASQAEKKLTMKQWIKKNLAAIQEQKAKAAAKASDLGEQEELLDEYEQGVIQSE